MASGSVKFFILTKDFGFIVPDDGGPDVFVHRRELRRSHISSLREGEKLTFDIEEGKPGKGPKAVNIALVR